MHWKFPFKSRLYKLFFFNNVLEAMFILLQSLWVPIINVVSLFMANTYGNHFCHFCTGFLEKLTLTTFDTKVLTRGL